MMEKTVQLLLTRVIVRGRYRHHSEECFGLPAEEIDNPATMYLGNFVSRCIGDLKYREIYIFIRLFMYISLYILDLPYYAE